MSIASQIRAARARLGWSQEQLAERAGVSPRTVKRAENEGRPPPSGPILKRIVNATGATIAIIPDTQETTCTKLK